MAYYGKGKYKFQDLIDSTTNKLAKRFLIYKWGCFYGDKSSEGKYDGYVEQMLYNVDAEEIRHQLTGFVAGKLDGKSSCEVDIIMASRDILPKLADIYIEMSRESNWGDSDDLKDWMDIKDCYGR